MSTPILHIRSGFLVGGPEKLILSGITGMDPARFQFSLASFVLPNKENQFLDFAAKQGVVTRPIAIAGSFDYAAVGKVRSLIAELRPRLIVSHDYRALAIALMARRKSALPIVAVAHGWTSQSLKVRIYEFIEGKLLKRVEGVAAVSKPKHAELARLGISSDRLRLIENGVIIPPPSKLARDPELKGDLGFEGESVLIGSVGRLSIEKGHRILVQAAALLRERFPRARYVFIGDGPLREELKTLAVELGVDNIVQFGGWRSDMEAVYRGLDIFALPSFTEGLPMALLEAMSYGVPSVTTKVGGCPDVIATEEMGRLCSAGDPSALAEVLAPLIDNAALRASISGAGYTRVAEHYSVARYVREFAELYDHVIEGTGQ
jgi:glycosyltransferase involved in cell wall biosynthesis